VPEELARQYRGLISFGPFAPLDPEEIGVLEREIGQAIPRAYRSFLEVANGGILEYSTHVPPRPAGDPVSFSDLHRLGSDQHGEYGWGTLVGEYRELPHSWLAQHLSVATLLPIACTGGGDQLLLDLASSQHGRVLGVVHGLSEWTGLGTRDRWGVLADDFDAYLDSLFIDPDVAEQVWSDTAGQDPADPGRRAVEQWLDSGLPGWRSQPWADKYPGNIRRGTQRSSGPQRQESHGERWISGRGPPSVGGVSMESGISRWADRRSPVYGHHSSE
jgi:SMI1-KNR4 cell-wall